MAELVIHALGSPSVELHGNAISVDTRKAIALLVYLALERQSRSRDSLAALLWPEYDQARSRAALRRTLSVLHKALDGQYLAIDRDQVTLEVSDAIWVDALEFRRLLAMRRTHGHAEKEVCAACLAPLRSAIDLYSDDFLSGFSLRDSLPFEEWESGQLQALRDELDAALAALTRCYILIGELRDAITVGRRWLAIDPLNEQAHRLLMRLYEWTGQSSAAERQYRECVRILERELGAAPLAVTARLFEAIRAHRLPGPPAPQDRDSTPSSPLVAEESAGDATPPTPTPLPAAAPPLIGRADELRAAIDAFTASAHAGQVIVIEGEAGIGKTRLANELVAYARRCGSVVGVARCYEGEAALAYSAAVALLRAIVGSEPAARLSALPDIWLGEASRLAPELLTTRAGVAAPGPLESPGAQNRFFEGLRETLIAACATGQPPGLLLLDDAQWADDASLDALSYLMRRIERQPVCVALTWRSDSVDTRHRLRGLLAETQRRGYARHIELQRLGADAVALWLRQCLGQGYKRATPDLAERLYAETEGLPFFISEYVMALANRGENGAEWVAPVGVSDLLRSRLRSLSETGWQTLTTAAALGRSFDFDLVRVVSGRSEEETAEALEELSARGLIREAPDTRPGEITYDFTHDKLRSLVYDDTSQGRRRLLHRRAAEALLEQGRRLRQSGERAARIAQHFEAAGDDAAAGRQHALAGGRARELYAHADAIWHFERALTLGHPDSLALRESIGDAYTHQGDYLSALTNYSQSAADAHGGDLGRIEHKIGVVHGRRGAWEEAQGFFAAAIAALGEGAGSQTEGEQARIYADWSLTARNLGQLPQAEEYAQRALTLASTGNDPIALAHALNILGALATSQGEIEKAIRILEESVSLAERLGDPAIRAAALNNLSLALQADNHYERALPLVEEALALSVAQGDRHHEAALHNNIADLLRAIGQVDDAMAHLKQAVTIYAEIGVEAGAIQPGIWKLVDW